jgi:hypothetical protein
MDPIIATSTATHVKTQTTKIAGSFSTSANAVIRFPKLKKLRLLRLWDDHITHQRFQSTERHCQSTCTSID